MTNTLDGAMSGIRDLVDGVGYVAKTLEGMRVYVCVCVCVCVFVKKYESFYVCMCDRDRFYEKED